MAYLRLPFCSPYKVFWPLATKARTPAERIHRAYARYVWQMYGIKAVPKVALYSVAWPIAFACLSWKHTRKLGGIVRGVTGKSLWHQVREQFHLSLRYSISPKKYFVAR